MKQDIRETIELPQGMTAAVRNSTVHIKGPKGELSRTMSSPGIRIKAEGQNITLAAAKASRHEKKMLYTFLAHIKNMVRGTQQPWVYRLRICSGHFPMTVTLAGNKFSVKNFLGEKVPRECRLPEGAEVKITGQEITVTSTDREIAGRVAGRLELLTFKPNKDQRVFQDGIYITEKPARGSI